MCRSSCALRHLKHEADEVRSQLQHRSDGGKRREQNSHLLPPYSRTSCPRSLACMPTCEHNAFIGGHGASPSWSAWTSVGWVRMLSARLARLARPVMASPAARCAAERSDGERV